MKLVLVCVCVCIYTNRDGLVIAISTNLKTSSWDFFRRFLSESLGYTEAIVLFLFFFFIFFFLCVDVKQVGIPKSEFPRALFLYSLFDDLRPLYFLSLPLSLYSRRQRRVELEVDCNQPFEKQITTFVFICCYGSNGPFRTVSTRFSSVRFSSSSSFFCVCMHLF